MVPRVSPPPAACPSPPPPPPPPPPSPPPRLQDLPADALARVAAHLRDPRDVVAWRRCARAAPWDGVPDDACAAAWARARMHELCALGEARARPRASRDDGAAWRALVALSRHPAYAVAVFARGALGGAEGGAAAAEAVLAPLHADGDGDGARASGARASGARASGAWLPHPPAGDASPRACWVVVHGARGEAPARIPLHRRAAALPNFARTLDVGRRGGAQCLVWAGAPGVQVHCLRERERRDGRCVVRDGSLAHVARVWEATREAGGAAAAAACGGGGGGGGGEAGFSALGRPLAAAPRSPSAAAARAGWCCVCA